MSTTATTAVLLWMLLTAVSVLTWLPASPRVTSRLSRVPVLVTTVAVLVVVLGSVAVLAGLGPPVTGPWRWAVVVLAALAAGLSGGSFATLVLALADASTRTVSARVQRDQLRGGAWIGIFERLGLVASLLAGWPEGIAVIVAVKGLARYPELKQTPSSGVTERFIIGTFASLAWALACTGVAVVFLTGGR